MSKSSLSFTSLVLDSIVGKLDSMKWIRVSFLPVVINVPTSLCHKMLNMSFFAGALDISLIPSVGVWCRGYLSPESKHELHCCAF